MQKKYNYNQRKSDTAHYIQAGKRKEDSKNSDINKQNNLNHYYRKSQDANIYSKKIINKNDILRENDEKIIESNLNTKSKNNTKNNNLNHELNNIFNEVEKFNAKNILSGDLAEIYDEVVKENTPFKDDIFFMNLNHYERNIGNCDNEVILHTFKDFKKEDLLKNKILSTQELYNKYDRKAKIIKEKEEF